MMYLVLGYSLQLLGILYLLFLCKAATHFIYDYFLKPFPSLTTMYPRKAYAIITGGSSGIGFEMAKLIALHSGLNLVLIARDVTRLEKARRDLQYLNPSVDIIVLPINAASPDYDLIALTMKSLEIRVLINNVGMINDLPANVDDMEPTVIQNIIAINISFQVHLTSLVIPFLRMKFASSRASILNISSLTSKVAMPMLSLYAASKAFLDHWSKCLAAELEPDRIDVTCLRPGLTATKMTGIKTASLFAPSAATMAFACLKFLGSGKLGFAPYWPHAIQDILNELVPTSSTWALVRKMHTEKRLKMLAEKRK